MDWLNDNVWLFWIGVGLVLAAIEAATVDFVFIMFAGGALAAAVAAGLGASFPVQVVVAVHLRRAGQLAQFQPLLIVDGLGDPGRRFVQGGDVDMKTWPVHFRPPACYPDNLVPSGKPRPRRPISFS